MSLPYLILLRYFLFNLETHYPVPQDIHISVISKVFAGIQIHASKEKLELFGASIDLVNLVTIMATYK